MSRYERSWRGILDYIEECVTDPQQKKQALFQLRQTRRNRINQQQKPKWDFTEPFYMYPLYHVFKEFIRKNFDKKIIALPPTGYQRKLLTIRINRAKGTHVAVRMSDIVKSLVNDGLSREYVAEQIGAKIFEVNLLLEDSIFTKHNVEQHTYSKSWVPNKKK